MFEGAGRSLWKEGFKIGFREGFQKGKEQAHLESIRNLSAHFNLSSAQAMEVLCISPKERCRLQAQLDHPETKGKG